MKAFMRIIMCLSLSLILCSASFAMTKDEVIDHYLSIEASKDTFFSDIAILPWAVEPIEELAKRGIVNGVGGGLFNPAGTVSRYEFIKMITSVCGLINENATSPWRDMAKEHWCYSFAASAHEAGILDIYSDVILNGIAPITREEIAYIAAKAMLKGKFIESLSYKKSPFVDFNEMSDFAPDSITTLSELGVINGRGGGIFSPKDYATRAEAAKIIYKVLNIVETNF